jgi:hypothetical protein
MIATIEVPAVLRRVAVLSAVLAIGLSRAVQSAPPQLYHQSAQESPTRGDPDDLLLLAGSGLAADDTVVYRALDVTTGAISAPRALPARSDATSGVADIVSVAGVPYSITVRLPAAVRANQSYALWVRTRGGEWSHAVMINDARPLWVSPTYVYASGMPAGLPRELKVVGRNLQPGAGQSTRIRLIGPQGITHTVTANGEASSTTLNEYVARAPLPAHIAPGTYRVQISRDGTSWVSLQGQRLEVKPDPGAAAEFSVGDARFGHCVPDDGADDTSCIVRAIGAAAEAGGGMVYFGPGTWDLVDSTQAGVGGADGIAVPTGVQLRGAGEGRTRLRRHSQWSSRAPTAAFTLASRTQVSGFLFQDLQIYTPGDQSAPFIQLGQGWRTSASGISAATSVQDVVITRNVFDKPKIAIGVGGLPIGRLFLTYNTFGAYHSGLELSGDQYSTSNKYRLDDSVIDYNVFKPGSELDVVQKSGTLASEVGAGFRVDFSGNTADGSSTDFLYSPQDPKGWRAAFFWSPTNDVEDVLISQNAATCTGDKIGDGEAIALDNNMNVFAFAKSPIVSDAANGSVTVPEPFLDRQYDVAVPAANYYVGDWVQVVSGAGLGQVRKIVGYATDTSSHRTVIRVAPDWDVVPLPGTTRISVGREYWQVFVVANHVDNRTPLCQKSNRSRKAAGIIGLWAQTADSVVAGNDQHDSDGILVQQNYAFQHLDSPSPTPCPSCSEMGFFNYFLEIRENVIDGEYDWSNDCSRSGIALGVGAAPGGAYPPPTVGFGVSISHNTVGHADAQYGGGIAQLNTAWIGPAPHRWPLSDNVLIYHNSIVNIDGPRALAICGASHPRVGIAFPSPAIAWRTVLYANSCRNVTTPIGDGGVNATRVCPSSVSDSCECPTSGK